MKRVAGLVMGFVVGLLPGLYAQSTGNIYGTTLDESAAVLPGAVVRLTSPFGTRETTSGSQGDFRFLNLDHGTYELTVSLAGFTSLKRSVIVSSGENVNVNFQLKVAKVEETVTVTAETPVVDTKKVGTALTISKEELAKVPSARDPWAMLRSVPGVIMDRVNVAGNENGQQANFTGKGDNGDNTMWNLDGVVITDTGSLSSPSYYDFDAFDEVSVSTGGNNIQAQTGGININLVTRRGTNAFHGGLHDYLASHKVESSNLPASLQHDSRLLLPNGTFATSGDHIAQIGDYGADIGGPIVKDKLWFYGSWGRQDIRDVRINQTNDRTILTSYNGKLNWQAGPNDMVSLFYFNGEKVKNGRSPGFPGVQDSDSFLWNQGGSYSGNLHGLIKGEIDHTFSPDFFASVKYSHYDTGFSLTPRGGDLNGTVDFAAGVSRGSYFQVVNTRPAQTVNGDASYFKTALGGNHEFKFGFGFRKFNVSSLTHWGGDGLLGYNFGPGASYVHVNRDADNNTGAHYYDGYLSDTFTKGRVTINAGLRYDYQDAFAVASTVPASKAFPNLLPALVYDGTTHAGPLPDPIVWKDFSPRVGITVALDDARKTVLRASYARYAAQLPSGQASFVSPIVSPGSYFAYIWNDTNGDGIPQPNEVRTDLGLQYFNYVNVNDPSGPSSNKLSGTSYIAQHDNEFIVGLEHELVANLAVSAAYTYRKGTDIGTWEPRIGMTPANYTTKTFSKNGYTAVGYIPDPALIALYGGGRILENRPDYHRTFNGAELSIMKRLSNRWMGRVAFTYNSPREYYDGPNAVQDPTRTDSNGRPGTGFFSGPQASGGIYAPRSSGSGKGDIFIGAKWQLVANVLVQLPAGCELSSAFFARQGQPVPIGFQASLGGDGPVRILADQTTALDTFSYPNVYDLDMRLAKNVRIGGSSFTLSADAFNVLNSNTVLNQGRFASSTAFNRINEVLAPRIVRFGIRYQF